MAASNVVPGAFLPGSLVMAASNIVPGASLPSTAAPAILGCVLPSDGANGGCANKRWCELPVVINIARYGRAVVGAGYCQASGNRAPTPMLRSRNSVFNNET